MNAKSLITALAGELCLLNLQPDADGDTAVKLGNRVIDIKARAQGTLVYLSTAVAKVTSFDRTLVLRAILDKNAQPAPAIPVDLETTQQLGCLLELNTESVAGGIAFGFDPASREVLLLRRLHAGSTRVDELMAALADFAGRANTLEENLRVS